MKTDSSAHLRAKISQVEVTQVPPEVEMPAKLQSFGGAIEQQRSGLSLGTWVLLLGVTSVLSFAIFDAVLGIVTHFDQYPVSASMLGLLLTGFVTCAVALIVREWRGYRAIRQRTDQHLDLESLAASDNRVEVLAALHRTTRQFTSSSYAARCATQFEQSVRPDHSAKELVALYQHQVRDAVERKAQEVLKKESVAAGSMAFISPNHLVQTLVLLWISLRTIKRVSLVFGLRPGHLGNWSLLKILAQNLAAQSVFDLATDEVTNQISGSLSAKFVENSAEAVAAGALNVRLGKALIRLLN